MRRFLLLILFTVVAYFYGRAQSGYALLREDGGSLSVCNNVVINNGGGQSNVTSTYNLLGHYPLFAHSYTDFHIVRPELVFNLGDNSCATWLYDMMGMFRKYNDTVDLGAYEYPHLVNFTVFQDYEGSLNICNNIIINNYSGENLNVTNTGTNYLTDGSGVFLNDYYGFRPKLESAVVNAGDNSCVIVTSDLTGDVRVQNETVDIGAFESHYGDEYFPVWQENGGNLIFCNNIMINNHVDSNVNVSVSQYNYVTNSELVFLHDFSNFTTQMHSVTVDAGQNNCAAAINRDLNGDERVANQTVDMGAFEVRYDRAYFPVYQEAGGSLHICNNIIMNNSVDTNVNVTVEDNNFITNGADIFMHTYINFRPKRMIPTLDAGQNSCVAGIDYDLAGEDRVLNTTVDIGAFEYRPPVINYPFYQEEGGALHICNNIIINNYADSNINVTAEDNNLVVDVPDVFVFEHSLFMLADGSVAIDAGSNTCAESINTDLCGTERVMNEQIDKGAFERFFWPRTFGVYQEEEGELNFCNNIFINNHSADSNVNVLLVQYNLVKDNDYVFTDKYLNYKLLDGSVAVDAGFNTCCETWEKDLMDTNRVLHEVVDLGAFELFIDVQRAIVFQDSGSTLNLCNNVIILNSPFAPNTNFTPVPESNIINDLVEVFRDELYDYRLLQTSVAVDAGDNGCNGLPTDLDTVKRISNGRIDIGAFEIPYEYINAGGSGGGGGGSGGGWGGGGYMVPDRNAIVYERNSYDLYLCNNIIINNDFAANTNASYGIDTVYCNLIKDTVSVFRDPVYDFRLIEVSIAVNRGRYDCNNLTLDIAKKDRVMQDTIDIGAFEFEPFPFYVAVNQVEEHQMLVCNNIIINNKNVFSVNDMSTPGNNLLIDNDRVFRENRMNFMPRENSPAINMGENDCNALATDIRDGVRIYADTIDIGAFEISHFSDSDLYVVWQKDGYHLNLCNNIIINNNGVNPVSDMTVSPYNLLVDHDDVFKDNVTDYSPRERSIVINVGDNSCCSLGLDLADEGRVFEDTIDLGAYEQGVSLEDTAFVILQKPGHHLELCNNIIVNNSVTIVTNITVVGGHNLFTDDGGLFVDASFNYTPRPHSAAVNAGDNVCCQLDADLCEKVRVYEEIIDIGAIEPSLIYDTTIALNGIDDEGMVADLTLCNNIIINNKYSKNLNIVNVPANNIVTDNDSLFVDNLYNYRVRPNSIAINQGSNACVSWGEDVEDNIRIHEEIVDIGAYEHYIDNPIFSAVLSDDTDALVLCNNIVINNAFSQNINLDAVPDNNIVTDDESLFIDKKFNYMPRSGSAAVDQGSNECADWAKDISTKGRVFAEIIDIGAYEVTVETVIDLYAVNGTDDGTGDDGSGSGGSGSGGSGSSGSGGSGSGSGGGGDDPGTGGGGDDPGTGGGGSGSGDTPADAMKLKLYNNIVINNAGHAMNVGGNVMGDHNLLNDIPNVFENEVGDYSLQQNSPAIDAGDNQWVSWPLDLKDDPRIACANIVDQGAFEYYFGDVTISLTSNEVATDNCQGYYIELTATAGAQHYYWSHSNEDTNTVQVSPLIPTLYTVIASNGGECVDTASLYVVPSALMADSLGAPASVGKTFWLSYLVNHFRTPTLTLNVSAEEACEGTVSNPRTGWSTSFTVGAHSVTTVTIPVDQAYPGITSPMAGIGDYGLLVETTDSVSLYAANYNVSSFDVTDVLPIDALSDEYVLQTYTPMMNAEFVVVATQDNTVIDITPTRALQGNHQANHTFSITLQAGQTYLGLSQYGGALGDLSGTLVKSHDNKPIAVFNGNVCALVPTDNSYTDHLVEQAIGIKYWGKSFAITSTENQNFDVLRVTALHSNTEVRKNGTLLTTLSAYQTYEFQLAGSEVSCYLETSKPAGVYLYIAGAMHGNSQERSDPSMIWIPPTEQKLSEITFATFNSPGISDHYVNIVIPASSIAEVMLDGMAIGGQFTLLNGSSDYAFVRKHIANGTHTLQCEGGFIAHCYGLGFHESYGYAAGSRAVPLKEQLFVNGILTTDLPADTKFCPYEPINFSTLVNYPCDSVVWNFGDNTPTVNATSTDHAYPEAGTYTVTATLYITSNGTVFCSNLYARIKVVDGPTIFYYDTICRGTVYVDHGFEVTAEENGHFSYTRTVEIAGQYCDSTFVLELEVLDNYLVIEDTVCFPHTYTEYGFHFIPESTGFYCDTLNAGLGSNGCDSLVILHLSVTPNTDNPPTIEGEGSPCLGDIYAYSIDSLSGLQNVEWTVPDSVIVMPQQNPYRLELMFDRELDSLEICVTAQGGCGEMSWCRVVYPQPYNQVYLYDTLCANVTEYDRYGFTLTGVSDTNDLFTRHDVASGGCDSVTILSLFFLPVYEMEDTISLCVNDFPYQYYDTSLATAGTHRVNLYTESGCDSIVYLTLNSNPISHSSFDTAVCNKMVWFGETYTESGSYDTVLTNIYGCDSTVTMNLTVYISDTVVVDSAVCRAQLPVVWNGLTFTDASVQTAYFQNEHDCDSLVVMTLNVKEATADTLMVTVLERNLPYNLNGEEYYAADTYTQNLTNAAGCDSSLTIILNVLNTVENSVDSTICSDMLPFEWNGVTFTQNDTLVATLHASNGADSMVVMNVTVLEVTYADVYDTVCESMTWIDGITYYESTDTATFTLFNAAGCDSIVTLHLVVNHAMNLAYEVDTCDWYRWNDSTYTATGTYTYSFADANGCTQVDTLHLTIYHATHEAYTVDTCDWYSWNGTIYDTSGTYTYSFADSNGCTQVDTLHLTINHSQIVAIYDTACNKFTWNDSTYYQSGAYVQYFHTIHSCDSVVTLHLIVNHSDTTEFDTVNCYAYTWNGVSYDSTGDYTQVLTNMYGCDSVVTLHLVINDTVFHHFEVVDCNSYTWNESTYTQAGDYVQHFAAQNTCDSMVTLHLTLYYDTATVWSVTSCDRYTWNDSTYYSTGEYVQHFATVHGCDSMVTLLLTVNHSQQVAIYDTACNEFTWNDSTYYQTGDYVQHFHTVYGCDSVVTLHLIVNHSDITEDYQTNCYSYTWNGVTYDSTGSYTQVLTNIHGCDSTVTLHLTINDTIFKDIEAENCYSYTWNGTTYNQSGEYVQYFTSQSECDSIVTLHLSIYQDTATIWSDTACLQYEWNDSTYYASGEYTQRFHTVHGCDSIVTLHLIVNFPQHIDTAVVAYDSYDWNGITYDSTGVYTYQHADANGCMQVDTLYLTVYYSSHNELADSACVSYQWNDSIYYRSGDYTQYFHDIHGADSTVTLHLTVFNPVHTAIQVDTCDWYTWNDSTYTTTGTYTYSFADANGCTQVDTLHLTLHYSADTVLYATVLENNLPYHLNDSAYQEEGTYMQYLHTRAGCDSTITLHLTVLYNVGTQLDSTVCADALPLTWNDSVFTAAGTKLMYFVAANGADSIVAMTLTVNALSYITLYATVVENNLPYHYLDSSYYASGEYTYILINALGCDSVVTLDLTVYGNVANEVDSVICENELPLTWNNSVFTASGSQVAVLTATTGADSVLTMNVTVIPTTYGTLDTTVLENDLPFVWNRESFNTEGYFNQDLQNYAGCDSILTIHLHISYNVTVHADSTVCESELPLVWNGVTFDYTSSEPLSGALTLVDSATILASTGVDSTIVMTVTVNPTTYGMIDITVMEDAFPLNYNGEDFAAAGVYTQNFPVMNQDGCDSVLTLYLHAKLYRDSVLCQTEMPLDWNGVHFELPGSASFNAPISLVDSAILTATTGVDSIVVMTVTVNPTTYGTFDTTLIENDLPLVLNGEEYDTEGSFEQILQSVNVHSCDSVLTVNVTVLYNVTVHKDSVLCQTELPLTWNGIVFELDDETVLNAPVTLVDSTILTASTGVDSTVVMSVTIHPVTYETMNVTIIENELPFVLNGVEYDTTAVYEQTLPNANAYGCDSVITLNLTVLYNVSIAADSTVCESELPLTWNGVVFELHEALATTAVVTLVDSAVLTASTGVDSTVMMTLQVIPTTYATMDTVVLENNLPLMLNGSSYLTPGTYVQTLYNANANGCDSVLTVNMTVLYNVRVEEDSTVCETELPLTWNGVTFAMQDVDGETHLAVDSAVLPALTGVDSTVVMTVYVIPTTYASVDTIVLENNLPLYFNDSVYQGNGVYTQYLVNNAGCDSVLTLNMTVLYNVTVTVDSVICDGELPFTWNGVTFAVEDIDSVTSSAMDSVVLIASTGVDSTVIMAVHVHYANTGIDVQTACDSYTWIDGVTYTASTETATYTLTNAAGCDSVVTLHLTVNHSAVAQDTLVLVENQLPYYIAAADTTISNGAPAEFQFNYHLSTIHGCDSTIAQTVIIHYNTSATVDTTVCASSLPYSWHGHWFTQAGSYNDTILNADGSDHVITYHLNVSNPAVTIQSITHINCYGDSTGGVGILVSGGIQPYNCHWENNAGTTVSTTAQLNNQPVGIYVLQVLDAIGCVALDSVTLQHQNDSMVAGVIASDRLVCHGSGVEGFTGTTATGGASSAYQWQISTNSTDWVAAPTPNNTQNYTYPNTVTSAFLLRRAWVSQACGTVYSNVVTVSVAPVYNDTLHENVCQGYPYQEYGFDVTAAETAEPTVITRVRNLQSVNSCDSTVTLVLTVIPSTHTTLTDESCQRVPYQANGFDLAAEELGTVGVHTFERVYTTSGCDSIVTLQLTIHPVYEIDFEDVVCEGSTYNNHGFDVTTVQTLGVSDVNMTQHLQSQNGCDSIVNLYLRVVDTSIAIVSLTADFCEEYTAELSVETNMTDYLWNTGETSQTITVNRPGTYMVTATQDNCSVTLWYTIDNCELNIYLPNAITPGNGDGLNDYFSLHEKYLPMIEDFEIRIYTRWGELIYYSDDKNFRWSGVRNPHTGEILINNIYTYLINFTDSRGIPYQLTGSITVL